MTGTKGEGKKGKKSIQEEGNTEMGRNGESKEIPKQIRDENGKEKGKG